MLNIANPNYPWFRFEYHAGEHKLYCVRIPLASLNGARETAQLMSDEVHEPHTAQLMVAAYLAGYQDKAEEGPLFNGKGPRHYKIFCEHGYAGIRLGK